MRRTNLSLIYVVAYLLAAGIFLLVAPRLALKLLFSIADYGVILPRLTGLLLIGLGMFVVQIIRYRVVTLGRHRRALGALVLLLAPPAGHAGERLTAHRRRFRL